MVEYGSPPGSFFGPALSRQLDNVVEPPVRAALRGVAPRAMPSSPSRTRSMNGCRGLPRVSRRSATSAAITTLGSLPPMPLHSGPAWGVSEGECLILWVGRMQVDNDEQPYKGFQELLALIPLLQGHIPQARFVLAGRVSDADQARLAARDLTVLANLSPQEMALGLCCGRRPAQPLEVGGLQSRPPGGAVPGHARSGLRSRPASGDRPAREDGVAGQDAAAAVRVRHPDHAGRAAEGSGCPRRPGVFASDFTWDRNVDELSAVITKSAGERAVQCRDRGAAGAGFVTHGKAGRRGEARPDWPEASPFPTRPAGPCARCWGAVTWNRPTSSRRATCRTTCSSSMSTSAW